GKVDPTPHRHLLWRIENKPRLGCAARRSALRKNRRLVSAQRICGCREMNRGNFFSELKRRNVLRAAILYVGAVWALAQGISQLGPSLGAPEWATRWFLVAAAIGFPFWIAFAWFYEFTPEGLKRESEIDRTESIPQRTGLKFDVTIIGVLTL